ncbi:hypothetical protein Taro_023551 [Colocasia esculenta]|uniref:Uncharacterized protein n=1 Tax=Colocasia esculenta TaxID=4460 RepID=A0A843V435_COLES|nr:hypothetical protein [Colocasia esculenta]
MASTQSSSFPLPSSPPPSPPYRPDSGVGVGRTHAKADCCNDLVALELARDDRLVLAVQEDQKCDVVEANICDVVEANMWTHNGGVVSLIHIKDESLPIREARKEKNRVP